MQKDKHMLWRWIMSTSMNFNKVLANQKNLRRLCTLTTVSQSLMLLIILYWRKLTSTLDWRMRRVSRLTLPTIVSSNSSSSSLYARGHRPIQYDRYYKQVAKKQARRNSEDVAALPTSQTGLKHLGLVAQRTLKQHKRLSFMSKHKFQFYFKKYLPSFRKRCQAAVIFCPTKHDQLTLSQLQKKSVSPIFREHKSKQPPMLNYILVEINK